MGLLEEILARGQWMPNGGGGFPAPLPVPTIDKDAEAADAAAAREAAGKKLATANRRRPPDPLTLAPDAQSAGVQLAMDQAPAGTGVPFSTQAGMLAPPVNIPGPEQPPAPLPPPITIGAPRSEGPATDITSRGRGGAAPPGAPLPIIPPAQAVMPPVPTGAEPEAGMLSGGLPSILGRIRTTMGDNSNSLLAMGAGFAGAPNWGQAISRAASAAIPARNADIAQKLTASTQYASMKAMKDAGVPDSLAHAALGSPTIMKSVVENYLGDRKTEIKDISLPNGTKVSVQFDPFTKKVTDMQGKPFNMDASMSSVVSPDLTGDEAASAAAAADPALHRQAMALVEGREAWPNARSMNNPRIKAATELARQIDPNLTEQDAIARKKYMEDAANTKNGVGAQVKGFHQGIEHLWGMAKEIEKFNPSSGMGSADLAHLVNSVKQRFGEDSSLARSIQARGQATAGEVGKLYSGSTGGGVHEREKTAALFGTGNSSAPELAGSLQGTIDLMEGGLSSLEQNRDRVMGARGSKSEKLQYRNAQTDARIADIKNVIARLKGEQSAPPAAPVAPAAPPVASKAEYDALAPGATYTAPDGSVRTKK